MSKHVINPDSCTACTSCVVNCPVLAVNNKFRGPKMLGPALERLRLLQNGEDSSLEYCSNCKNCDISCPSGVPISTLNMLARAQYYRSHKQSRRDYILSHGEKAARLVSSIPGMPAIANLGMKVGRQLKLLDYIGIAGKAPLPTYTSEPFLAQFKRLKQVSYKDKVVFFPGCYINYNQPQVGLDFVSVMQKNEIEVLVDEAFVCCGSPLVVNGYLDEAHQNAKKNTNLLSRWASEGYPVITCCTSCGLMLKQEYQELFGFDDSEKIKEKLYDSMEYLEIMAERGRLNTEFSAVERKFLYHAPCHLRAHGIGLPALNIMELIPGFTLENADAGCCGISGNYGFKADRYNTAMAVGKELFDKIKESGVDTVLCDCGTCRLQISHGAGVKTEHPISVLNRAYKLKTSG